EEIEATRDAVTAYRDVLALVKLRQKIGAVGASDVAAQETALAAIEGQLPALERARKAQEAQIAVLIGVAPGSPLPPVPRMDELTLPAQLPLSLPAQVIAHRPDVRSAAAIMEGTSADARAAVAARLPSFTLSAQYGGTANSFADMFATGNPFWTLLGGVSAPIFHAGSLLHQSHAAKAALEAAQEAARIARFGFSMRLHRKFAFALPLAIALAACGASKPQESAKEEAPKKDSSLVLLSDEQIGSAGIQFTHPTVGGAGKLDLPALIEGDPQGTQVVSAAIGGRVVALSRNLGQSVQRGAVLAVIESREAAQLNGEVKASRARLALAQSNLAREERLFAQRVSPEQDVIAARTAAAEARIAYAQAAQQVAATGGGGGGLNPLSILAPASGQFIARSVVLGPTVDVDAELYRVANLAQVSLSLSLQQGDAGRIRSGAEVIVRAAGREAQGRISFISPALDEKTRLVPVIATLDNRDGRWRVGEPVTASITLAGTGAETGMTVPTTAIQTVDGKPAVFVRVKGGFRVMPVVLGDAAGAMIVVRRGLSAGDQIATTNSFTLKAEIGKGEAGEED
ncbi:hypothetical protein E4T56_gene5283, partial [Termitomyces sp. T112]